MVCRAWYYSVNDKPTFQISVPLDDGSYKRLYEDLVKYPTFGLKVSSISDVVEYLASPTLEASQYFPATSYTPKEGEDYNSRYFYSVLGFCPFLNKRCLSPKSIKWLHQCLEKRRHQYRSQEEANHILNVKELISQKRFGGTSGRITQHKRYFQVCLKLSASITQLDILLAQDNIKKSETLLKEISGIGLTRYTSNLANNKLKKVCISSSKARCNVISATTIEILMAAPIIQYPNSDC